MDQSGKDQAPSDLESLTERELEIIELMRAGLTNKEIARQMSLAYETIKWYTKRIYSKLNIKNRNQLIPRLENLPRLRPNANTLEKYGRWASPLTTFIGRAAEKEALLKIVSNNRLVSIVGPGGIGKTRMALEIGRLAETHLERKTYLLTAEPFHTRDEFLFSLADLFHISLNSYDAPINQIAAGLPSVPMLLIIDNFESVIDTAPDLIPLLTHNSNLNILLTSRSATRLNDEMIFWLNGLSQEADSSRGNEAIHLFRARAYMSHQQHSRQENDAEIVKICQLVGGNPLAIELAASWSRSLTHQQILTELKSGLEILASDSLDISDRHRSMTAICEQSWLTLRPAARKAALKLGLFESSFSWEAAREIASLSLNTITTLLDHSIIRRVPGGYLSMHPVLRRFILRQQNRLKFNSAPTQKRFTNYYIQRLITFGKEIHSSKQIEALDAIEQELDHILKAWRWAAQTKDATFIKQSLEPLALFFEVRDHSKQGSALFAETLTHFNEDDEITIGLLLFQGWHEVWLGNTVGGSSSMFKAIELSDKMGLTGFWPLPISMLSFNEQFAQEIRSGLETRYLTEREAHLAQGNFQGAAWMAYGLGNITRPTEAFDRSVAFFKESLQHFQSQQDYYGISFALDGLSTTQSRMGDLNGAWETAMQLRATSLQLGNTTHLAVTGEMFGQLREKQGNPAAAFHEYREGLKYGVINTNASNIVPHLFHLGRLMAEHDLGTAEWGVKLLTLVQTHPYSQAGWFAFRQKESQEWLNILQNKMTRESYLTAVVQGKQLDLLEGAKEFLETAS